MATNPSNVERLQEGGVIIGDLPEPYIAVVEGMSSQEVEAVLTLKANLDKAREGVQHDPDYVVYFVPL